MGLKQYRALVIVVIVAVSLFIASPVIQRLIVLPQTEFFTELSILGQYHNASYPYVIRNFEKYRVYINAENHEGAYSSYQIQLKFRSHQQALAESNSHTQSREPAIASFPIDMGDKEKYELPLDFSISYQYAESRSGVEIQSITLNNVAYGSNQLVLEWNSEKGGFTGNLLIELWKYDNIAGEFLYETSVSLWLKLVF